MYYKLLLHSFHCNGTLCLSAVPQMFLPDVPTPLENCHQTFHTCCAAQHMLQQHLTQFLTDGRTHFHRPLSLPKAFFSIGILALLCLKLYLQITHIHAFSGYGFMTHGNTGLGKQDRPGAPKVPVPEKSATSNQGEVSHSFLCDELTNTLASCTLPGQPIYLSRNSPLWSTTACICNAIIALTVIIIRSTLSGTHNTYTCPINSPSHLRKSPACLKHGNNVPKPLACRKTREGDV